MTFQQIKEKIRENIKNDVGRTVCTCGKKLKAASLANYPHPGGIELEDLLNKRWLYLSCNHCGYDWALWKLHMKLDLNREK